MNKQSVFFVNHSAGTVILKRLTAVLLCILYFIASPASAEQKAASDAKVVEATVKALYRSIKFYDYDAMRDLVTPGFELTFQGVRMSQPEFERHLRNGGGSYDPDEPPPLHRQYKLVDFEIEVAGDVAFSRSTYMDKDPNTDDNYDLVVLHRNNEDDGRWRVHIIFHMAKAKQEEVTE